MPLYFHRKEKLAEDKRKLAEKKTQKQMAKEESDAKKEAASDEKPSDDKKKEDDKSKDSNGVNILSFYGKEAKEVEDNADSDGKNWGSILSERRVNAAKAAALKEKMERERAEQREKEYQVYNRLHIITQC